VRGIGAERGHLVTKTLGKNLSRVGLKTFGGNTKKKLEGCMDWFRGN